MYEITLKGSPYERGVQQGKAYTLELQTLLNSVPIWLRDMPPAQAAEIQGRMVAYLHSAFPEMISELEGISAGCGLDFESVCRVNFVSAISALNGCTNMVLLNASPGPLLAKTSDIGEDYQFYAVQEVHPEQGLAYLAVGWTGCLWAEVGINEAGLAVGQSSGPTQPGQNGTGLPTLEYPRYILERCTTIDEAIAFCKQTPMAGKGLNIAAVNAAGEGVIIEKSGTATAVRYPSMQGQSNQSGAAHNSVYCANIFLEKEMQGFKALASPEMPNLTENSRQRLDIVDQFLRTTPNPSIQIIETLLQTPLLGQGLCQQQYTSLITHFAYMLFPQQRKMVLYEGVAEKRLTQKQYFI
jgi:predicted choloylglycine hydrolase